MLDLNGAIRAVHSLHRNQLPPITLKDRYVPSHANDVEFERMPGERRPLCILLVDDDADDRFLTKRALESSGLTHRLEIVEDGEQLLEYLRREGRYGDSAVSPRPDLILLDLNMPRKDGREALEEIKSDASLRRIPVVVLTTSEADQDVEASYDLGVNAFVKKPVAFHTLASVMRRLGAFWFEVVELPKQR